MYDNVVHLIVLIIEKLIWNKENIDHIKKHDVTRVEINQVVKRDYNNQPTYGNRLMIFGKTKKGRKLTVILIEKEKNNYLIITARDMSKKERKYFLND